MWSAWIGFILLFTISSIHSAPFEDHDDSPSTGELHAETSIKVSGTDDDESDQPKELVLTELTETHEPIDEDTSAEEGHRVLTDTRHIDVEEMITENIETSPEHDDHPPSHAEARADNPSLPFLPSPAEGLGGAAVESVSPTLFMGTFQMLRMAMPQSIPGLPALPALPGGLSGLIPSQTLVAG